MLFQWVRMVCGKKTNTEEQKCQSPLNFFSKPSFCTADVPYIQWVSCGGVLYAGFTNATFSCRNKQGALIQGQCIIWVKDLRGKCKHLEPGLPAQFRADTGLTPRDKCNSWHMGVAVWCATLTSAPWPSFNSPHLVSRCWAVI